VNFEAYLISKKIDSATFLKAEPEVWRTWSSEFEHLHPSSFTAQKLYLINPIRRKYPLKQEPLNTEVRSGLPVTEKSPETAANPETPATNSAALNPKPLIPKPVFKPKPKMD